MSHIISFLRYRMAMRPLDADSRSTVSRTLIYLWDLWRSSWAFTTTLRWRGWLASRLASCWNEASRSKWCHSFSAKQSCMIFWCPMRREVLIPGCMRGLLWLSLSVDSIAILLLLLTSHLYILPLWWLIICATALFWTQKCAARWTKMSTFALQMETTSWSRVLKKAYSLLF